MAWTRSSPITGESFTSRFGFTAPFIGESFLLLRRVFAGIDRAPLGPAATNLHQFRVGDAGADSHGSRRLIPENKAAQNEGLCRGIVVSKSPGVV
jgi:hypothetical protein